MSTLPSSGPWSRRRFLTTSSSALVASSAAGKSLAPSEQLKVAAIGMGGRMRPHVDQLLKLGHHVSAFCDVDEGQIDAAKARHPDAAEKIASYKDYRVLLEKEKALDAVIISTPDHWHAPICRAAMAAGKHVFCEKPLTHTLAEARELRELHRESKVATQTGNQGSASPNIRRSMELIASGMLGDITEVHVWHPGLKAPYGTNRPKKGDPVPRGLDWDFWLGPAPQRPFKSSIYHPGQWRAWYDFGNGTLGDFCCHSFNLPLRALELDYPDRIAIVGEPLGKETFPTSSTTSFHFPAKGKRARVMLHFHVGDGLPQRFVDDLSGTFGSLPRVGCLLQGTKGQLSAGLWNSQCYVRLDGEAKFRGADNHDAAKAIPQSIPRSAGHMEEWLNACRGRGKTFADFDHGGHLTEIGLAGIVALRLGRDIEWDGPNMKVVGAPEADQYIRKTDRPDYL